MPILQVLFQIQEIVVIGGQDQPYVLCNFVEVYKYNSHFAAFEINCQTNQPQKCTILKIGSLAGPPINLHITSQGLQMIRPKQY